MHGKIKSQTAREKAKPKDGRKTVGFAVITSLFNSLK